MIIGNKREIKTQFFEEMMADTGGGGATGTKFSGAAIAQRLAEIRTKYEALEAAVSACADAGAKAVAAGGPGAGGAIQTAIVDVTSNDLAAVRSQLEAMEAQFSQVQTQYANKNAELIASIKAIAQGAADTAAGGGSGLGTSTNLAR